eukprot:gene6969-7754_t
MQATKWGNLMYLFGTIILLFLLTDVQASISCDTSGSQSETFMKCWLKEVTSGKSDLVFLMDRSGSMKTAGFQAAKNFITMLLKEVRVSFSSTRVALVSFARQSSIDINYIWNPTTANHKCKFVEDFKKVQFQGGLTNLRGALNDAHTIFGQLFGNAITNKNRPDASKTIMLLSDGKGNIDGNGMVNIWDGNDVSDEIRKIRAFVNVDVFTVAVTNETDRDQLQNKIASHPYLFMYQPDFKALKKITRLIRGDPYEHDYELSEVPGSECEEGCDSKAKCGCNLLSGNFKCACEMGYYGTGEKLDAGSSCKECPADTYGNKVGLAYQCFKCPDNSGTRGATKQTSLSQCTCNIGYEKDINHKFLCKKKTCNPVIAISDGKVANADECKKSEFGTTCIFKCNDGFKLHGNDVLQCNENKQWVGTKPICEPLRCSGSVVQKTSTYNVSCHGKQDRQTKEYEIGAVCTFICNENYYHDSGDKVRKCMQTKAWNGTNFQCKEIVCDKQVKTHEKLTTAASSADCLNKNLKIDESCTFNCTSEFEIVGSKVITCKKGPGRGRGVWMNRNGFGAPNCSAIGVTDNSGGPIVVRSDPPGSEFGRAYKFPITTSQKLVTFTASDPSGNTRACRFYIQILDNEPPKLLKCPSDITVESTLEKTKVNWTIPTYSDNCGTYEQCPITVTSNFYPLNSEFSLGKKEEVRYEGKDPSGNKNVDCTFFVEVKAPSCGKLRVPKNGMISYPTDKTAFATCHNGKYPVKPFAYFYACRSSGWVDSMTNQPANITDCIKKSPPSGLDSSVFSYFFYNGDCSSNATKEKVIQNIKMLGLCSFGCTIDSVKSYCSSSSVVARRRRRALSTLSVTITIKVTTTAEKAIQDPTGSQLSARMGTVAPQVMSKIRGTTGWNSKVESGIFNHITTYGGFYKSKTCADMGEIYKANAGVQEQCSHCPAGEFKNLASGACQKCSPGTFQPNEGSTSCIACPKGSTTIGDDVKSPASCRKICQPGEYSENGLAPCTISPPGTYTEGERQTSSTPCPTGTTTVTPGASSRFHCGTKCEPGTFSSNGVEPCSPCEQGSYQSNRGQLSCIDCPGLTWTYGEGADSLSACTDIDSCASNPCLSNGHCIDLKVGFRCECRPGFWGKRCEKEVNDCSLKPCLNGGHCLDKLGGYSCICPHGVKGKNCEDVNDICKAGLCGSNGDCTVLADNSFKCICKNGFMGQFCESFADPCQTNPCENNGECSSLISDFNCVCRPGFTGKTCENKLNYCASQPCKNGGECTDGTNGFTCKCSNFFYGVKCEFHKHMCQHKVCKHSVGCTDLGTDVKCSCKPGYGGKLCDKKLGNDFDIGFQTRQSPSFSFVEGKFDITQFTVAFWMRSSDTLNKGTPISYANKDKGKVNDNALVVSDYGDFELTINNISVALNFDANDGEWHHIAVTWSSSNGIWVAYKDGSEITRATTALQRGQTIRKGGIFVIGEEQDEIGGGFTTTESFFGDLSQLNIWRRVLSANEIYDLTMSCKHAAGDVLAWNDFGEQKHGSIVKTEPSVTCNCKLYDLDSSSSRDNVDAGACATICATDPAAQTCRSFIHEKKINRCTFYIKSLLIEKQQPIRAANIDLYQLSCVNALGMEDGRIPNNKITASSSLAGTYPYMARINNVPVSPSNFAHWSPAYVGWHFIQVDLGSDHKITGIATQGHWNENVNEFTSYYFVSYKRQSASDWSYYSTKLEANKNAKDIVRHEVMFHASIVQLRPFKRSTVSRIALRFELYGCTSRPQGQPQIKNDGNQCAASPCKNGGQCVDLYQRYACICPTGYVGSQCQTDASCPDPDVPVYGSLVSKTSTRVTVKCNPGYRLVGHNTKQCVSGKWIGPTPTCISPNECAENICSQGCQNLEGGYRCYCQKGYRLASDGRTCNDINECAMANGGCNHHCHNSIGAYRCSCRAGFKLSGRLQCVDINECAGSHGCSQNCLNTLGSYGCSCNMGYSLSSDGKGCNKITCPYLPNIANGRVSRGASTTGFSCNSGYKISGSTVRECHPDGQWSGVQPICTRVTCTNLKGETAIVTVSGNSYGSVARFSCRSSYRLFGSSSRTCSQSGEWSNTQPRCARSSCPVLRNPLHGKILGLGSSVGSVVRVKCNMGYRLVQSNLELRTCHSNGQWTGGNTATMTCQVIDCGRPASSPSLVITLHGNTYYQARVTYSCSQIGGQRCLDGPSTRYCNADGQWSGKQPTCIANSCCKPSIPSHSTFYSDNSYNYGNKVYTKCDAGYVTGGSDLRTCQNNGQWSGSQTTCTIQNCGNPGTVTNGIRLMSSTTYKSTARYFCNPGYTLRGSGNRVCQADGTWSGQATSCIFSNCGGRKLAQSGTIVSNDGTKECHWLIRVTEGKKVSLRFNSFTLGPNDQLKIFDGEKYDEFVTFTKENQPRALTGNTHLMRVIYIGGKNPGSGFSLSFKEAKCGGLLGSENGVITSPGFPNDYKPNDECFWTIFRTSQRLQLSFETFQLYNEAGDYLEVFEGPFVGSRELLKRHSDTNTPLVERAERWMWVHFKVNSGNHASGFKGYYRPYEPRSSDDYL